MTVKLTVTRDNVFVEAFQFPDDHQRIVVGRNEECEVCVESDSISRHHCEIMLEDGFHRLTDLGSSHGTYVNGKRVIDASLNPGDVITVGEFNVAYSASFAVKKPQAMFKGGGLPTIEVGVDATSSGRAIAQARAHLVIEDDAASRNVILHAPTFIIGTVPNAGLRLSGWFAPRVAALIMNDRVGFRVWDTSPRGNVLWVNSKPMRETELRDGDAIVVAGRVMRFYKGLPKLGGDAVETRESRAYLPKSGEDPGRR